MTESTLLDQAYQAMEAAPEDESLRLRFYERLADSELFLLLEREAEGEEITPEVFETSDASFVLVFDLESRLTGFTGQTSAYAALSGRAICQMLVNSGLGLALNVEVAPSSFLLPPSGVAWLAEMLEHAPDEVQQEISQCFAPKGIPEDLLLALDTKLASATGLARSAYLVGVEYGSGAQGHMLAFIDAIPGAEPSLARAVSEALRFSGLEAAMVDVGFFRSDDLVAARLAKEGLRFDLPQHEAPHLPREAPGSNPDKPPILR